MNKTLCIVTCGQHKIWDDNSDAGPTAVRNVYTRGFSMAGCRFAEAFYEGRWCILSAKYGFIFPEELIPADYNARFKCLVKRIEYGLVGRERLIIQAHSIQSRYDSVIVIAGKCYVRIVQDVLPEMPLDNPLAGLGIGYKSQVLSQAVKTGDNIHEVRRRLGL